MRGANLSQDEKNLIINYAITGRSAHEAATALRRSVGAVYRAARVNGVAFNGGHRKVGPSNLLVLRGDDETTPFDDLSACLEDDLIERIHEEPKPASDLCLLTTTSRTIEMQGEHLRLRIASSEETVICVAIDDICGTPEAACQALCRLITEASEAMAAIDREAVK